MLVNLASGRNSTAQADVHNTVSRMLKNTTQEISQAEHFLVPVHVTRNHWVCLSCIESYGSVCHGYGTERKTRMLTYERTES
jgi:hypothetical protein